MARGGREPRVSDEDILELFRETNDPVLSTAEVADALPIGRRGVLDRLHSLEDEKKLMSKNIGGRNIVWWLLKEVESGEGSDPSGEMGGSSETTLDTESDELDTQATPTVDDGLPDGKVNIETTTDDALAEDVRAYLEANDVPPKTEHGRDAVIDVFRYLREHGTAKTSEVREALAPDHADRYSNEKAMWESVRRYLEDIPGIEKRGHGKYGYAGDDTVRGNL